MQNHFYWKSRNCFEKLSSCRFQTCPWWFLNVKTKLRYQQKHYWTLWDALYELGLDFLHKLKVTSQPGLTGYFCSNCNIWCIVMSHQSLEITAKTYFSVLWTIWMKRKYLIILLSSLKWKIVSWIVDPLKMW